MADEEKKDTDTDDTKKDDDTKDDSSSDTAVSDKKSDPKSDDKETDLEAKITAIVQKVLAGVSPNDRTPTRRADVEKEAERMVREASERLKLEEEHKKEHETIKEIAEKPPRKLRRSTRILWGSDE